MGILSAFKKQFIDVIDWVESEPGVLAYRYPMTDREIQNGGQLTVRESQMAVFVNEGQIADVFGPGRYTLTTQTLPILTNLMNWDKAFASPFKSDVFFFSTREQLDQKWGTPNPITLKDKDFGPIRLRAFGSYSYHIYHPDVFFNKVSATQEKYTIQELEGQLRSGILTSIGSYLGKGEVPFLEMAANQESFSQNLKKAIRAFFESYGLELDTFFVQNLSLPEELQKYFDKAASMRMVGDLRKYAQFQTAESLQAAASNPSGLAGVGAGMGAGMAVGQAMASAFGNVGKSESEDPFETLNKLHELVQKGIITQAEFDAKKAELLKKI